MNTDIVMNNTSTPTGNNNNYVAVKVTRGEEMRRFQFNGKSFQEIKDAIALLFSIPANDFTLQYQDDEKDRVTLSSDAELNEAIKLHKYVLRFYVVNKSAPIPAAATFPIPSPQGFAHHAPPSPQVMVVADGEVASPATPPHHPHPYHGHHHGHGHPYGHHGGMMRGGRHGFPGAGHPHHGPHGHGPHHEHHHKNKRHFDKEEREAWKLEKKRFKKQRKCEKESSSSSSSEEDIQKVQRKEMKQLMKATKQQIKKNWAATKDANPAQWPENRKLMIAEIKAAKKLIHEQAHMNLTATALVPVGQNVTASNVATEMQA